MSTIYEEFVGIVRDGIQPEDAKRVVQVIKNKMTPENISQFVVDTLDHLLSDEQDEQLLETLNAISTFVDEQRNAIAQRRTDAMLDETGI